MKFDQACLLGKELGRRGVTHVRSLLSLTLSIIHVPHSAAASTTDTEIFPSLSLSLSQMIITITTLVAMIQPLPPAAAASDSQQQQ